MAHRLITWLLILAMVNCLVGCSSQRFVGVHEVTDRGYLQRPPVTITAVILPSSQEVTFDDRGGRYFEDTETIIGWTHDGRIVEIVLDDVALLRVRKHTESDTTESVIGPQIFKNERPWHRKVILSIRLHSGEIVVFDEYGGWMYHNQGVVMGRALNGSPTVIKFEDIGSVRIKKFNLVTTILGVSGITVALVALVVTILLIPYLDEPFFQIHPNAPGADTGR